jgi:hypothetical protein
VLIESNNFKDEMPPEVIASGWLGYPGATEEQIKKAELRLGTTLPPAYREFLKVTNGWRQLSPFIYNLWSTEEIKWFALRNQDWIDAYVQPYAALESVPDEEYFVYGDEQDSVLIRVEYLQTALEISDTGDSSILLLNPQIVTAGGEWEAWFFATWLPGATRYRSFWEMMQDEYQSFLHLLEDSSDADLAK